LPIRLATSLKKLSTLVINSRPDRFVVVSSLLFYDGLFEY
jgi:hypothetical protein